MASVNDIGHWCGKNAAHGISFIPSTVHEERRTSFVSALSYPGMGDVLG